MKIIQKLIDKALAHNSEYIQILEYVSPTILNLAKQNISEISQPNLQQKNHQLNDKKNKIKRFFYHIPSLNRILSSQKNSNLNTDFLFNDLLLQIDVSQIATKSKDAEFKLKPEHAFIDPFTLRPTLSLFNLKTSESCNFETQQDPSNQSMIKTELILNQNEIEGNYHSTQNDFANVFAEIANELSKSGVNVLNFRIDDHTGNFAVICHSDDCGLVATRYQIQYIADGVLEAYGKSATCYHSTMY